mmetsp:Transcript_61840/g.141557  ORF Transcript_61840/g.141557 Transcript_61840/m.141557 type:complete len:170 (+) Transcript_61840:2-511(+)
MKLLQHDVPVWLIEADSTWFANPTYVLSELRDLDVIVGQDGGLTWDLPESGFIFMNATANARAMQAALISQHDTVLRASDQSVGELGAIASEMLMLPKLLKSVRWTSFPRKHFVGGWWYKDAKFRAEVEPVVVQNNWIAGNVNKVARAKQWGHWFLGSDGACLDRADEG